MTPQQAFHNLRQDHYLALGYEFPWARACAAADTAQVFCELAAEAEVQRDHDEEREHGWSIPDGR